MESRKITVIQTKTQTKSVIMSSATTLKELKNDFKDNNIDYSDMTFYEGVSKTELKTDESYLPHDIPYKGTNTNELVIMLTNSNKKIKSGSMTRREILYTIKEMKLQNICVEKFHKNFTQCKSDDLMSLIKEYSNKENTNKETTKPPVNEVQTNKKESCKCETRVVEVVDKASREALKTLISLLTDAEYLEYDDVKEILESLKDNSSKVLKKEEKTTNKETINSSYSEDDLKEMMSCMNLN